MLENFNPIGEADALDDFVHQFRAVEVAQSGFAFASESYRPLRDAMAKRGGFGGTALLPCRNDA